jgi:hypothetical protein
MHGWPASVAVRSAAMVACVLTPTSLGGQAAAPYGVVTGSGALVALQALVDDVAGGDVLLVVERAPAAAAADLERVLLSALADRRAMTLVLGALDAAAQEPLEHFLMGHTTFTEFVSATGVAPAATTAEKSLLDLARARSWSVRAAGTAAGADRAASVADAVRSAYDIGARQTLVVAIVDLKDPDALRQLGDRIRERVPAVRLRSVVVAAEVSASVDPAGVPTRPDYVMYTARR